MGFSRQEYWSGLPCPSPGDLPNLGIEPLMSPALAGRFFTTSVTWEVLSFPQVPPNLKYFPLVTSVGKSFLCWKKKCPFLNALPRSAYSHVFSCLRVQFTCLPRISPVSLLCALLCAPGPPSFLRPRAASPHPPGTQHHLLRAKLSALGKACLNSTELRTYGKNVTWGQEYFFFHLAGPHQPVE